MYNHAVIGGDLQLPKDLGCLRPSTKSCTSLFKHDAHAPGVYLEFARADLSDTDCARSRVNALSNAKRALHWQAEALTDALGFRRWPRARPKHFPSRLEFLSECLLVTPAILKKLNTLRNEVEHRYVVPERGTLEDYVDVVELYLASSDPLVGAFPDLHEFYVSGEQGRQYCLCTTRHSGVIRVYQADWRSCLRASSEAGGSTAEGESVSSDESIPSAIEFADVASDPTRYFRLAQLFLGRLG